MFRYSSFSYKLLLILVLVCLAKFGYADDIANTPDLATTAQNTIVDSTIVGNPHDWGLTATEWGRYQRLMQGPARLWYPHLTPPEVLGLNAQTLLERQHFAEIVAQEEHDKLARELIFNNAVHTAFLRLYAKEPVIQPFNFSSFNPLMGK